MTTLTHSDPSGYGGYKFWAIEPKFEGKTLWSGFSRNDAVDFWNAHSLSDADFRIVGMI